MFKEHDLCPKCDRGHLFNLDEHEGAVVLSCDLEDCQYMLSADGVPRCPECIGSGRFMCETTNPAVARFKCYSCSHEFEAPRRQSSKTPPQTPPIPSILPCPHCSPDGYHGPTTRVGTLTNAGAQINTYHCRTCSNDFFTDQKSPHTTITVHPHKGVQKQEAPASFRRPKNIHDLALTHIREAAAPAWRPADTWKAHAANGPLGVQYWWPKGLSQERREQFLDDAIALLGLTGPSANIDEEAYAVADNLFQLWWEGIKR